ncbi:DUF983 domain-containing protein [Halodurantibacterium flavum]|uniref:DUF983 domain-containing protein n=1 Tax=Halodurantibacterium flavum TaxID=1382802 RepID=A0ABW4S052_9RHOB
MSGDKAGDGADHRAARERRAAMWHGTMGTCPNCGEGRLFSGYLRVAAECNVCHEPLGEYRAADGPAFFAISIVGLLLVPILGFGFVFFRDNPVALLTVTVIGVTVLTLVTLRLVKGAFIGFLWASGDRDPGS